MSRNGLILMACLCVAVPAAKALASQAATPAPATPAAAPSATAPVPPSSSGRAASSPRKGKGSGFWTSDVPAEGNKYRYGMMAVGAVIALMMGLFVIWLIRRHAPARQ